AFVGGDDTGVCELLIDRIRVCDEEVLALLSPPCGAGRGESQTSLTEQPDPFGEAHSPDIIPPKLESGQAPSRKKSATQMRVSAAREERQREKKTAVAVEWSDDVSGVTDSDLDYLFPAPDAAVAPSAPTKTDDSNSAPAESVEIRLNKTPRQNGGSSRAPAKRQSLLA
uniref:RPAP1_N domain-containing protein n=1 Tax=Macrostomum lignano TaxID=282301 RepID=A0A1I8GBK5_9PLAT